MSIIKVFLLADSWHIIYVKSNNLYSIAGSITLIVNVIVIDKNQLNAACNFFNCSFFSVFAEKDCMNIVQLSFYLQWNCQRIVELSVRTTRMRTRTMINDNLSNFVILSLVSLHKNFATDNSVVESWRWDPC